MTNRSVVLGVDGATGGWVIAQAAPATNGALTLESLSFADSLSDSVKRLSSSNEFGVDVIAVDMPIGLPVDGNRPADSLARQRLGPRRSTFFPTPIRATLDFDDYAAANAHSKHASGSGLSKQAWNLLPKIREVDALWSHEFAGRLVEAHPETSFAEIAGEPVMTKKATAQGQYERLELLSSIYADGFEECLAELPPKWRVDAIDACAVAWSAKRHALGVAEVLGGEIDPMGRPMQLTI